MGCTYQAVLGYVASALSNFRSQLEELDPHNENVEQFLWAKWYRHFDRYEAYEV